MKKLNYLSRSQLQKIHRLGSVRNANRVLKRMSHLLNSFRDVENIYYLNQEGREFVDSKKICKKTPHINHYLMRNDLYIACGCPSTWKNELSFRVNGKDFIIADARYITDKSYYVIEIDYSQKMINNKNKINRYRELINIGAFKKPPYFLWVTTTEYRRKQLLKLSEGLDITVYLQSDFN